MNDIIMRYEDYLIHTKHASDNTVASYMRDLRQYASYLGSEGIDVLDADQDVVSGYMNSMKANGKSAATISRALASIKSLYIFAVQNREIEEGITERFSRNFADMSDMTYRAVAYAAVSIDGGTLTVRYRENSVDTGECVKYRAFGIKKAAKGND